MEVEEYIWYSSHRIKVFGNGIKYDLKIPVKTRLVMKVSHPQCHSHEKRFEMMKRILPM